MSGHPQVLLIDGMSLLVRAAKAAQNMSLLSHNGRDTRTLVAFTGSLVRALNASPWTHVVVAWEGAPDLNWRKQFYPAYKSNRPRHHDDAPVMSIAEELAQEFTEAAGIYQTWESSFEGDDIIASAWRQFHAMPAWPPQMTILSADRDLLQLVDPATSWQAGSGEGLTEYDVRRDWGVEPARLPLLRALAGDASDGIPGIPGIGPARAVKMIDPEKSDLAVIHSMVTTLGLERQAQVYAWWVISNLRDPVLAPEQTLGERCEHAEWHPGRHSEPMQAFLEKWGMNRLRLRMEAGSLPWPPVAAVQ